MAYFLKHIRLNLPIPNCIINNRDIYIDMTRFVGIILMVAGHSCFVYYFEG